MAIDLRTRLASELLGTRTAPREKPKKRKYTVTNTATRAQHLEGHRWKKGQSGNPRGRLPKNLSLVSLVKERLENYPEDASAIALALVNLGKRANMRAIEELLNRIDGKVTETHRIEGDLPIKILFVPALELLKMGERQAIEGESSELKEEEK